MIEPEAVYWITVAIGVILGFLLGFNIGLLYVEQKWKRALEGTDFDSSEEWNNDKC